MITIKLQKDNYDYEESKFSKADSVFSGISTRPMTIVEPIYDVPTDARLSVDYKTKMDFSQIVGKPFLIGTRSWVSTQNQGDNINTFSIPDAFLSLPLLRIPFLSSSKWRSRMKVAVQVNGTPMHQGTVIVYVIPPGSNNYFGVSPVLACPHVLLSANQSTSALLEIPFYTPTNLAECGVTNTDYFALSAFSKTVAHIRTRVLNPLVAPTGGTTFLTISYYVMFEDPEFFVPNVVASSSAEADFVPQSLITNLIDRSLPSIKKFINDGIDNARASVKGYTGLDNPSIGLNTQFSKVSFKAPHNLVDVPIMIDKMKVFSDEVSLAVPTTFSTNCDEMLISNIITKPGYLGTFAINSADTTGTFLFSRPMHPVCNPVDFDSDKSPLIQKLAYMTRYWRGTLHFDFHVSASNMHMARIIVAKQYGLPSTNTRPAYNDIFGLQTESFELSAGGQVHTLTCEYNSQTYVLPCQPSYTVNPRSMGSFFVYLAQPLTVTNNIATTINVNVFVRAGSDFNFYGYNALSCMYPPSAAAAPLLVRDALSELSDQSSSQEEFVPQSTITPFNVISEPVETNKDNTESYEPVIQNMYKPLVSVRDIVRRFHKVLVGTMRSNVTGANSAGEYIPIINIIGMPNTVSYRNSLYAICSLFHGFKGSLKFKLSVAPVDTTGATSLTNGVPVYVVYLPPTHQGNVSSNSLLNFGNTPSSLTGTPTTNYLIQLQESIGVGALSGYANATSHPSPLFVGSSRNGFVEFEIDIQTIFRFNILTKTFENDQDYATGLGALYVYIDPNIVLPSSPSLNYTLYCGFGDDARLGFQVYNPNFTISYKTADPAIGAVPTFLPLDFNQTMSTPILNNWYYTKTT